MRKLAVALISCFILVLIFSGQVIAGGKYSHCTTIQDGLYASDGSEIVLGYDEWGYNYQAHMFKGPYCYYDRHYDPDNPDWNDIYCDIYLIMKWNDAWLSNKDCDGDGSLDRHYGFDSYIGSGAWLTNHMSGTYIDDYGNECNWTYFVKIVVVPEDAIKKEGYWYTPDGEEIGPVIWEQFAIVQEVSNDPCVGEHGVLYLSPVGPGFGKFK